MNRCHNLAQATAGSQTERWLVLFLFLLLTPFRSAPATEFAAVNSIHVVTNVAQFKTLAPADFLDGCNFHLTGVVTLADTNRDLVVLQDATGAVALNFKNSHQAFQVGRLVAVDGTNCCPLFLSFPNFPYRPSGHEICQSFEAPENWGDFNLTRMRGYLHPPVTGEYRFWIASDDSSELWLSTDANPANVRKIAAVPRFTWTDPHQWSRLPSQRSEPIYLKAGESYFIEAVQEQTEVNENLSVAWQPPALKESDIAVIDGKYLTPWRVENGSPTNGILREFWTNYFNGNVEGMLGPRPYKSALTVKEIAATDCGAGNFPTSQKIDWSQPLTADNNWHWIAAKGLVKFKAFDKSAAWFEIFDGQSLIPVRVMNWDEKQSNKFKSLTNAVLQVEGVCESFDDLGPIMPSLICAPSPANVSFFESESTNEFTLTTNQITTIAGKSSVSGYFGTRDVVTFNDDVFGKDYIFIQAENSALMVSLANDIPASQFKVGCYVDLGGSLETGKYMQSIKPSFATELGPHPMPQAAVYSSGAQIQASQVGRWTEAEGVVRSANTNGTISLSTKSGTVFIWLGNMSSNFLEQCVDAKIRARGVLMLDLLESPTLLVPSRDYLDRLEEPPVNPFDLPASSVAGVLSADGSTLESHRVHVAGEITYQDENSFFVQDASGGIRIRSMAKDLKVGEAIDVVGFPTISESSLHLTEPLLRHQKTGKKISPKTLDFNEARQNGSLIQVNATLLAQRNSGGLQSLELQNQQRVFLATLSDSQGALPIMPSGSRVLLTGICSYENSFIPTTNSVSSRLQLLSSPIILLRSPRDVILVGGPPWWTWKKTATLVGLLFTIAAVALLRVHLLQRRLERQQAAQLAFSRHVLGKLEEERRRIAVNLHDSLGQTLHVIKNHADLAAQSPTEAPAVKNRLGEISSTTTEAIEEVRRITHGLRPYQLDRLGLTQSIRTLIGQAAENRQISFASRIEEIDGLFDKEAEIQFYRIAQEAVTNVTKHSAATEATVVIKRQMTMVSLSVRDNGKGFDSTKLQSPSPEQGFGLTGMAERVRILGGTLTIDSKSQGGTSLTVEVPVKNS